MGWEEIICVVYHMLSKLLTSAGGSVSGTAGNALNGSASMIILLAAQLAGVLVYEGKGGGGF